MAAIIMIAAITMNELIHVRVSRLKLMRFIVEVERFYNDDTLLEQYVASPTTCLTLVTNKIGAVSVLWDRDNNIFCFMFASDDQAIKFKLAFGEWCCD